MDTLSKLINHCVQSNYNCNRFNKNSCKKSNMKQAPRCREVHVEVGDFRLEREREEKKKGIRIRAALMTVGDQKKNVGGEPDGGGRIMALPSARPDGGPASVTSPVADAV